MSSVLFDGGPHSGPPPYPVHRFTVAEYEQLAHSGILTEDSNVELLQGWIVPKMPKHPPHDSAIDVVQYLLLSLLPAGWFIRVQNSVVTADSIPEPDLAVVRGKPGDYKHEHPRGANVGLIVEVADSTVQRDRTKAAVYAQAGIPHYWIVNLDDRQIERYSLVAGGGYAAPQIVTGDMVLPVILAGQSIGTLKASELLA